MTGRVMTSRARYHRMGLLSAVGTGAKRGEMAYTAVHYLFVTTALASLWAAAGRANGGSVAGYSTNALIWYIATTEVTTVTIPLRLIERLGDDIASGQIEIELLRPASPLGVRVVTEMGAMISRLGLCVGIGVAFATLAGGPAPVPAALALAAPALVMGTTLNLVTQHLFAAAAFWLRDAKSAWFLYQKLVFTLGGLLLPLEVLPSAVGRLARLTPFAAMSYVPARLASGHLEPGWLAVQASWLVALGWAATRAFAAGERAVVEGGS